MDDDAADWYLTAWPAQMKQQLGQLRLKIREGMESESSKQQLTLQIATVNHAEIRRRPKTPDSPPEMLQRGGQSPTSILGAAHWQGRSIFSVLPLTSRSVGDARRGPVMENIYAAT